MSFFFTKKKAEPGKAKAEPPPLAPSRSAAKNINTLHRLGCSACPLNHASIQSPKMEPTLGSGSVYFLAESPGAEDDAEGQALTGVDGQVLRECFPSGILPPSFDNVINCCHSRADREPLWNEAECCRPRRWNYINEAKPRLIVGLGTAALHWALNSRDMSGMRGRLFVVRVGEHVCWFMPTYHPSFVREISAKSGNVTRPLQSRLGHCLRMDIRRAFELADKIKPPEIVDERTVRADIETITGQGANDAARVSELLSRVKQAKIAAIDVETKGLDPRAADACICSVAFSTQGCNFAFALDHPKAGWTPRQREIIGEQLREVVDGSTVKIAHNAPFEIEWFTWLFGCEVANHANWECTQMQAHFLDERRGKQGRGDDDRRAPYQNLDFLCKAQFGIAFKSMFKLNKKDMTQSDLGEVLIYNGVDTKYTLKLWMKQDKRLKELGLHEAYTDALPRQTSVALMRTIGLDVDQTVVKQVQEEMGAEIARLESQIQELPDVRVFGQFNPYSPKDGVTLFTRLGYGKTLKGKEAEINASVDKSILSKIDHPLARLIEELRVKAKLKSTYIDGLAIGGAMLGPDGKLHAHFNTTFTETGRTSSDGPNMQNFPKRNDSWVRKQITAPKGHVLVAFDYGQLEGCTAAMCCKDKALVASLWDNYDIHAEWARKVVDKYPSIALGLEFAEVRSLIKNKLVFPAIYGAMSSSIAGYLNMPEDIIDDLMDEFWVQFSGLKKWQDGVMKHYYEHGWVASPNGRRRNYPITRSQAINHPVQSLACDIVCHAMNELSATALETGNWHLHPILNIHDDLTFVIPDTNMDLEESVSIISKTMLKPPYSCVNVPLSVSWSIGSSWYGMTEMGKLWSHKDV